MGAGANQVSLVERDDLKTWMLRFRAIQAVEIAEQHRGWIESKRPTFGPEIQERFDWALSVPREEAEAASRARIEWTGYLKGLVGDDRVICLPTAPHIAPLITSSEEEVREQRLRVLCLTSPAGMSGLPQVTMPLASVEGCPVGLSLIGPPNGDMMLLALAEAIGRD